jgi:hypothetical protein
MTQSHRRPWPDGWREVPFERAASVRQEEGAPVFWMDTHRFGPSAWSQARDATAAPSPSDAVLRALEWLQA